MIPGCSSLAEVRASRWKRSTNSLSNAREKGSTLIATSRSSCFSRALKTIAMPPRPSSSRISYSSLSWSRTMSRSVISGAGSRPPAIGVAAKSRPQDRQNLLASSFWVPQRGQYINAPRSRGNLGIRRSGCQLDTGDADSKVGAERGVELRSTGRARRRGGERLRDAEPHRELEVVAQRDVARQLETGRAQAREARRERSSFDQRVALSSSRRRYVTDHETPCSGDTDSAPSTRRDSVSVTEPPTRLRVAHAGHSGVSAVSGIAA